MREESHSSVSEARVHDEGKGVEARRIVKVGDWDLVAFTGKGDEEPRIKDLDLAERLGFERPRKVRDLIKQHRVATE